MPQDREAARHEPSGKPRCVQRRKDQQRDPQRLSVLSASLRVVSSDRNRGVYGGSFAGPAPASSVLAAAVLTTDRSMHPCRYHGRGGRRRTAEECLHQSNRSHAGVVLWPKELDPRLRYRSPAPNSKRTTPPSKSMRLAWACLLDHLKTDWCQSDRSRNVPPANRLAASFAHRTGQSCVR